ncbi:uncharacterized protein LOC128674709 [Plodia interpunctella]|uniref:uncharacterized protein LOC128674709 n=1 Tax=Plodia interpunctella TaxID=58824 RepID=UPI0023684269|nr:uncharacterized protein LOC128674709 [Plodia interpunctella]
MESLDQEIVKYITEEDIKDIVKKCGYAHKDVTFVYYIENASDKMLGFLADYWRLQIHITNDQSESRKVLPFFVKAISRSNEAKASMATEFNLFQKEVLFYSVIKKKLELNDLKPWSPEMITIINEDTMVFEDLAVSQYKSRNKFERFDMAHTLQALNTLARFHATSIIYEENNSKHLRRTYRLYDEFSHQFLEERGYAKTNTWFIQCMNGALEAVREFSKYKDNEKLLIKVGEDWKNIWFSALDICNYSTKYRNVICHRDLWNNNIMFRYKKVEDGMEPDDCIFVDFQAVHFQPPAGDVIILLYCNLDTKVREENSNLFLNYYYKELSTNLENHGIVINDVLSKEDFLNSAEELKKWGLIVRACLTPQIWIDDEFTTKIFSDTEQFNDIMAKNKGKFIKTMMLMNPNYKDKVIEVFDEIIERYCINNEISSQ